MCLHSPSLLPPSSVSSPAHRGLSLPCLLNHSPGVWSWPGSTPPEGVPPSQGPLPPPSDLFSRSRPQAHLISQTTIGPFSWIPPYPDGRMLSTPEPSPTPEPTHNAAASPGLRFHPPGPISHITPHPVRVRSGRIHALPGPLAEISYRWSISRFSLPRSEYGCAGNPSPPSPVSLGLSPHQVPYLFVDPASLPASQELYPRPIPIRIKVQNPFFDQ